MLDKDSLAIFLISVVIFTIGLSPEFVGFDCRFAVFAKEMLRNGPTFFPTTYGQPYPDYPGTSTFLIYLVSLSFGKVSPFTAILPTAIVSALILVLIYRIGATHSQQWGILAVLLALFTIEFFSYSRSISVDQYTTLTTILCFYLAYSADIYNKHKHLWFIPPLFMVGFAFRGPIGLIIPAGVICAYYLYNKDIMKFAVMASLSAMLLVFCSFALLAAAKYQGGELFVRQVIQSQVTGRISDDPKHWIGYYFTESFARYAISYPFAVIVAVVLHKKIFGRENDDYRLLASLIIWILVVLIGMSIPGTKKIRYVLPMIPAVTLVASYMFISPVQKRILFLIKKIFLQFCSWFPLGTAIIIPALWAARGKFIFLSEIHFITVLIISIILAIAVWVSNQIFKDSAIRDLAYIAVGTVTFILIIVGINEPINYYYNNTKPFVAKIETLRFQQPGEIIFYKIYPNSEAIRFMANLDEQLNPRFIRDAEDILDFQIPAYFIALKDDFYALPKNVTSHIKRLDSGKIGRDDCIVFLCESSKLRNRR